MKSLYFFDFQNLFSFILEDKFYVRFWLTVWVELKAIFGTGRQFRMRVFQEKLFENVDFEILT
jgi:hypothetical protein